MWERWGGPEDDTLHGGPGSDHLRGNNESAETTVNDGNDHILAVDGEQDDIACGSGTDTVEADAVDVVADDCETVNIATP